MRCWPLLLLLIVVRAETSPLGIPDFKVADLEVLAVGFQFTEGPAWNPDGYWIFSDIPANTIYKYTDNGVKIGTISPSGYANGNVINAGGQIISARHNRTMGITEKGKLINLATHYDKGKLNSPNDLALDQYGNIWFTDPVYGITGSGPEKAAQEQPVRGVYRFDNKTGRLELEIGDLTKPNGIAFSRDWKRLYVSDSSIGVVYQFVLGEDGRPGPKRFFAKVPPQVNQKPRVDGLAVDLEGNLWVTGPKALGVFDPEGVPLYRMDFPDAKQLTNIAFGGPDGRSALVTAADRVYHFRVVKE
ncbi:SMP-30/gluconolactonase/LRE family protein [Endozoicomonas arenosclerae]|uniref:SMP-30/gluconolactonase/LRE family protein n=1 Tax=Endozoicomonas arenosclerae TaxID=1633495 RepID=UPI0007805D8C|nr:SMP-30/gluconolactonase/LRE family protein [Endozoicomonas arenosclerae]